MPEFVPSWKQPSHPDRIRVHKAGSGSGSAGFTTSSRSLVALPAGALFSKIEGSKPVERDAWNTVAIGPDARIDLNSDLTYTNHSCDPSLVFDMARYEVRVADHRPLAVGDELTFFYPSTEWKMAQPFHCTCGSSRCLGYITGAASMEPAILEKYWLNDFIRQLVEQQTLQSEKVRSVQHV